MMFSSKSVQLYLIPHYTTVLSALALVGFHSDVVFLQLLMHTVLCREWEGCVGSSSFTHRLRAATPDPHILSLQFRAGEIFHRSYKQ